MELVSIAERVVLSARARAPRTPVALEAEGPGIPAGELPRVFDRFSRSDGPRERAGAGLGPAISAALVAAHDGYVTAGSPPGGGCVFTVVLPPG
ncbi:sensor histidine kinase [Nocardiopsis dassonvillei]|uniref:sensor histidine kinase n=1 Tax=Nocardiopsis dassonvillei TaxID=2014 RepID=UPI00363B62C2